MSLLCKADQVRFCPRCGAKAIDRDWYKNERHRPDKGCQWLCRACGLGFRVHPSLRAQEAMVLFSQHRRLQVSDPTRDGRHGSSKEKTDGTAAPASCQDAPAEPRAQEHGDTRPRAATPTRAQDQGEALVK